MTYAKTTEFDADIQEMAAYAKAMSHPARMAILRFLAEQKQCISGDISDHLPLSRTTVSQHLQELKRAGLIQGTVRGIKVNYCLNPVGIQKMKNLMGSFLEEIDIKDITCK